MSLREWIAQLAGSNPQEREAAAAELYRSGRALGDAAIAAWRTDDQFSSLLTGEATVGIAVQPENFERIRAAFGSPRLADVPPDQDAQEFELHLHTNAGAIQLDILTCRSSDPAGAIFKFLEKFGEGIQQVEFFVRDVDRATAIIRERFGGQPVYPATRNGADSTRVNFFLASTPDGKRVLVELVEKN